MNTSKRSSILIAVGVAAAVTVWMLSGLGGGPVDFGNENGAGENSGAAMRVRVEEISSSDVTREIVVSARTEPNRLVRMKAETDGAVVALGTGRGNTVRDGEVLIELDIRDRNARLAEVDALIAQRELEFEGIQNLRDQQFTSQVQIAEARTQLQSARASKERLLIEIGNTVIVAPFNGILQERNVEIGDYVRAGDEVVELVDIDPLIIAGEINGKEVGELVVGGKGDAVLVDGTVLSGNIRYLAPVADDNTRTFKVELAVPNTEKIRAGLAAELQLDGSNILAHDISPSLLTLADDGTIGVKTVNRSNRVDFYPIEIVGSTDEGILVTGLPETVTVITVGQGFVTVGQLVEPVVQSSSPENNTSYERAN